MRHFTLLAALLPGAALAHPGDHSATGFQHTLTQPDHLALLAVVVMAAAALRWLWVRK